MLACNTRKYNLIDKTKIDTMLKELTSNGAAVKGCNPWNIVTHQHGIVLSAEWNEVVMTLVVSVTHRNWYVSYKTIWNIIDSLIKQLCETETE